MHTRRRRGRFLRGFLIAAAVTVAVGTPVTAKAAPQSENPEVTRASYSFNAEIRPNVTRLRPQSEVLTRPQPDEPPKLALFKNTQLAPRFWRFYRASGGLPIFGHPISPPVMEEGRVTQYLQRQRFEHHPENRGTPFEVLLGRLGAEEAQTRGLLGTAPFQPRPAPSQSNDNCLFFQETGHYLCAGFRNFWQTHGLELGDHGVSLREAVALFGYPISEEFTDPQTGYTVQYFERARFEYHPENAGTPYDILLGLVGEPLWRARAQRAILANVPSLGEQIAAAAKKYVGTSYVWGGTTPAGFDCSGLVYHVVNEVLGGGFPRNLAAQANSGRPVDPSALQPGDLVFQQNTYKWGLSHAGIYIGNGQFVNAANPGVGVTISNLWDSYWGPRFYAARRIR